MKSLSLLILLGISVTTFAATKFGAECGLTDTKDDSWKEVKKAISLADLTIYQINALPTLTKQQVIITAKDFAPASEKSKIKNTLDAVNYMRRADGPFVSEYRVKGRRYTEVLSYPGDNPVGLVFKTGTLHIVASNGDDDIVCR